jgi:hypothetical protein
MTSWVIKPTILRLVAQFLYQIQTFERHLDVDLYNVIVSKCSVYKLFFRECEKLDLN